MSDELRDASDPDIRFKPEPDGPLRVDLRVGGVSHSHCWICPFTIRVGAARVRMDGIGGVHTDEEFRNRGYSRRVLEAAVRKMTARDAAVSMLYGIRDLYPKFGYATAGPEHAIRLTSPARESWLPEGWTARPIGSDDLPDMLALYHQSTARESGPAIRSIDRPPVKGLGESIASAPKANKGKGDDETRDECRVLISPDGRLAAYAWRGTGCWSANAAQSENPESLVIAEAFADGPESADAMIALCLAWAHDAGKTTDDSRSRLLLPMPHRGPIAEAAMLLDAEFIQTWQGCGESMIRVLDVDRLLEQVAPELIERSKLLPPDLRGPIRFVTEIGEGRLEFAPGGGPERVVELPQADLGRLAIGAFPPGIILGRLKTPPDDVTRNLLTILFPERAPHMYRVDRY